MAVEQFKAKTSGGYIGKGAIALAILAGTMVFTNPPREDYINYASDQLSTEIKKSICQESQVPDFLSGIANSLVGSCNSLVSTQRNFIKRFVDQSTTRQNAVLFSIYTTDIVGYRYQTLAGFGNFLTFPVEKQTQQPLRIQSKEGV